MTEERKLQIVIESQNNAGADLNVVVSQLKEMNKYLYSTMLATKSVAQGNQKLSTSAKAVSQSFTKQNKSMLKTVLGIGTLMFTLKRLTHFFTRTVNKSNEFIENMNLFEVSMGKNINEANRFANAISESFGFDKSEIVRYMGLFANLSESMGNTSESALAVSKALITVGYDLASLYNTSTERAMEALSSGLVGQTKPLRRFGIDTTYQTLEEFKENLDTSDLSLKKYVDELDLGTPIKLMSQADKQLLRTIAILEQSRSAWGDMSKTINEPANQMKVLKAQLDQVTRAFGTLTYGIMGKVLPALNGFLMALFQVVMAISTALGFKLPDYNADAGFDKMPKTIDNVGTSVDKLKKKLGLLSFDEITNISTKTDADDSSGGGQGQFGDILTNKINEMMAEYNEKLVQTTSLATGIRDKIMEWLGFTKEINELTDEVTFKYEGMSEVIKGILSVLTIMFVGAIFKGIIAFAGWLLKITGLGSLIKYAFIGVKVVIGALIATFGLIPVIIAGVIIGAIAIIWAFRDKIAEFMSWFVTSWLDGVGIIGKFFADIWSKISKGVSDTWTNLTNTFSKIGKFFSDTFTTAWNNIKKLFNSGGQIFEGMKDGISSIFKTILNHLLQGINTIIGTPFKTINKLLNTIRSTSFLGISPFEGLWKENPLPIPKIPKLADGGVITRPMMYNGAITGENYRKEAIIPLQNSKVVEAFSARISDNLASILGDVNKEPIITKIYLDGTYIQENVTTRTRQKNNQFGKATI
jgi:hypothetical protein